MSSDTEATIAPAAPPSAVCCFSFIELTGELSEKIARIAHDADRAWCAAFGWPGSAGWSHCTPGDREARIEAVLMIITTPGADASTLHDDWCEVMRRNGWRHGAAHDGIARTSPGLIAFDRLPIDQQRRQAMFVGIVRALSLGLR
ncbi:hypothetical protein N9164_16870 [Draconibacterium sp.]|nr:hypothetical protein [Draconibacterium sp.]